MEGEFHVRMDSEGILANNKITLLKAGERSAAYLSGLNHERATCCIT